MLFNCCSRFHGVFHSLLYLSVGFSRCGAELGHNRVKMRFDRQLCENVYRELWQFRKHFPNGCRECKCTFVNFHCHTHTKLEWSEELFCFCPAEHGPSSRYYTVRRGFYDICNISIFVWFLIFNTVTVLRK